VLHQLCLIIAHMYVGVDDEGYVSVTLGQTQKVTYVDAPRKDSKKRVGASTDGKVVPKKARVPRDTICIDTDMVDLTMEAPVCNLPAQPQEEDPLLRPKTKYAWNPVYDKNRTPTQRMTEYPWAFSVLTPEGRTRIGCDCCSWANGKEYTMDCKTQRMKDHADSLKHQRNFVKFASKGRFDPAKLFAAEPLEQAGLPEIAQRMADDMAAKKLPQLASVYYLMGKNRPMTDYEDLQDFIEYVNGEALSQHHNSAKSGWAFAEAIDEELILQLRAEIRACRFFSVSVDESEHFMSVELYFYIPNTGTVNRFVKLSKCAGLDAYSLKEQLIAALREVLSLSVREISQRLVGTGCDGCSVMLGSQTGMVKQVTEDVAPFNVPVHCTSHRIALVSLVLKDSNLYNRVENMLKMAYNYSSRSHKRKEELVQVIEQLNMDVLQLLQVHQIRWLSVDGVLERFVQLWPALLEFYDQHGNDGEPVAQFIYNEMCDVEVLLGCHALVVALNEMNRLTKFTQMLNNTYYDIMDDLQVAKKYLRDCFVDPSTAFKDEVIFRQWNVYAEDADSPLQWQEVEGVDVLLYEVKVADEVVSTHVMTMKGDVRSRSTNIEDMAQFNNAKARVKAEMKSLAGKLLDDFEERFPPNSLMAAMGIIHPAFWGTKPTDEVINRHIAVLHEQYGLDRKCSDGTVVTALIDFEKVEEELWFFKSYMRRHHNMYMFTHALWVAVDAAPNCRIRMPEIIELSRLIQCIPVGSVQNERRFSSMNLIRSKLRNRLLEPHLNVCMRISAATKNKKTFKDFDYKAALKRWQTSASKRVGVGKQLSKSSKT
jgi:hypothetical protein